MTKDEEVRFLRGVLQQIDSPSDPTQLGLLAKTLIWLALVGAGIIAFQYFGSPSLSQVVACLIGLVVGGVGMFFITTNVFGRHILAACRVADRGRVEARLRELGA